MYNPIYIKENAISLHCLQWRKPQNIKRSLITIFSKHQNNVLSLGSKHFERSRLMLRCPPLDLMNVDDDAPTSIFPLINENYPLKRAISKRKKKEED
jgi:hypothetical protein